mmetsp:Transcript_8017/g.7166  ORF Transcript_8017/g.7166 Transcript_8017/m.7166 type:complete len:144 (+) Transcript_8017:134-565(+)
MKFLFLLTLISILSIVYSFNPTTGLRRSRMISNNKSGVRGLTQIIDVLAGISLANQLSNSPMNAKFLSSTLPVAATEVRQGLYREYSVDKVDDSALDANIKTYKTAEETDEGKTKYWAILGVLLAGSFIIPMVQYYWYVADED